MSGEDNVVPFAPPQGGGKVVATTRENDSPVSNELTHLAKREDIANMEAKLMKWLLTILSAAVIAVLAALARTFLN